MRERYKRLKKWSANSFLFLSFLNLINIFGQLEPNDLLYYSLFVHQLDQKHLPDLLFRWVTLCSDVITNKAAAASHSRPNKTDSLEPFYKSQSKDKVSCRCKLYNFMSFKCTQIRLPNNTYKVCRREIKLSEMTSYELIK